MLYTESIELYLDEHAPGRTRSRTGPEAKSIHY